MMQTTPSDLANYSTKDQASAFLFSAFLGSYGIDRFYVGQTGLGIAKLLTCGGVGVWALIDTFIIGTGGMRDNNGLPLRREPAVGTPQKSQSTAFILSALLGFVGADRFYLGYTLLGILKLLTCGGFFIWALVDYVIIGMGKMKDSEGNSLLYS